MSSLMNSLGIDRLSTDDRLQLVGEILHSLEVDRQSPELSPAKRRELDRRLAVLDAAETTLSDWNSVEARLLERLRR
jgi:putative addiction module component (TIGR02574 family)